MRIPAPAPAERVEESLRILLPSHSYRIRRPAAASITVQIPKPTICPARGRRGARATPEGGGMARKHIRIFRTLGITIISQMGGLMGTPPPPQQKISSHPLTPRSQNFNRPLPHWPETSRRRTGNFVG